MTTTAAGASPVDCPVGRLEPERDTDGQRGTYGCACLDRDSVQCAAIRCTEDTDPVVGHKTYRDGPLGFRHEPLRSSEAVVIMAAVEAADKLRAELMPDERAAIRMMFEARQRLIELGWIDATYCPKDGSEFDAIEPGSTGIHRCHYSGEWPNGGWLVADDGDLYPSRPVLYRKTPNDKGNRLAPQQETP